MKRFNDTMKALYGIMACLFAWPLLVEDILRQYFELCTPLKVLAIIAIIVMLYGYVLVLIDLIKINFSAWKESKNERDKN